MKKTFDYLFAVLKTVNLPPHPTRLSLIKLIALISFSLLSPVSTFGQGCYPSYIVINGNISNCFSGSSVVGGKYKVTTGLTIDKDFTFDGTEIRFSSGAGIQVNAGKNLTITKKSYLTACENNNMWEGITVNGSISHFSTISVDSLSIIEDAITGVTLNTGYSYCQFDRAIFNRNYRHVYYNVNNQNTTQGLSLSKIINSFFYCKNTANSSGVDGYYLKVPYSNQRTNIAIELNYFVPINCSSMSIGEMNQGNEIINCNKGIYAFQFTTNIQYNTFSKTNFGIEQHDNSCAYIKQNYFTDCQTGIYLFNIHDVDVLENQLENGITGIKVGLMSGATSIVENEITDYSNGILFVNSNYSSPAQTAYINSNVLSAVNSSGLFGIRVQENLNVNNAIYEISENTLTNFQKGICIVNVRNKPKIIDNPAIYVNPIPVNGRINYGILAANCQDVSILNNYVYSDD